MSNQFKFITSIKLGQKLMYEIYDKIKSGLSRTEKKEVENYCNFVNIHINSN